MEEKPKSRSGCLWAVILVQSGLLFVLFLAFLLYAAVGASLNSTPRTHGAGIDENPDLQEVWAYGSGDTKVALIPLQGLIFLDEENGLFSVGGSMHLTLRAIRRATHDDRVRAIILDVDSPGGGITASDKIYHALLEFKAAQRGRKVVCVFGDTAASGAYYVAMAADHIIAHPTSITGSIGVLMQTYNVKGLGDKIGVKAVTIKSGANKDLLNPFEDINPEQKALLQEAIDEMHGRFVGIVAQGRRMKEETVRKLADGRIYTAVKARDIGLVDDIGYLKDAMRKVSGMLGVREIRVYRYQQEFSLADILRSQSSVDPTMRMLDRLTRTRFYYLWQP